MSKFGIVIHDSVSLPLGDREVFINRGPGPLGGPVRPIVAPASQGVFVVHKLVSEFSMKTCVGLQRAGRIGSPQALVPP